MLEELHVRDLALIDDVWLEFGLGMTALTGETGAGKTALVGALKLLVGERADSMLVRSGAAEALIEGRFVDEHGEVLARRRVGADGRSRCTINDEISTVSALATRLGPLVDLHGQHEHQALLAPASHVGYLDRHAGKVVGQALEAYQEARERYLLTERIHRERAATLRESEQQADYLKFVAAEISAAAIRPGEDADLEARLPGLRHGEKLAAGAAQAVSVLRTDGGASDMVSSALAFLGKVAGLDPALDALAQQLADVRDTLDDVSISVRAYGESLDHDSRTLDEVEGRLATLASLKKKYGPTLDDVARTAGDALDRLALLEEGTDGLRAARESLSAAEKDLRQTAAVLDAHRREAVSGFVDALAAASEDLAMPSARFEVAFTDLPFETWTSVGPHRVEFLYAAVPSQPARPLARIASGGEVSRVMLALKSVLGDADVVPILVFDEIDAGIGGATAHTVGRRLAALAADHQVIVVTHLAQVAAFADRQLVVVRSTEQDLTSTRVEPVVGEQRVLEIARMLSGADSEASLIHARELLEDAGPHRSAAAAERGH